MPGGSTPRSTQKLPCASGSVTNSAVGPSRSRAWPGVPSATWRTMLALPVVDCICFSFLICGQPEHLGQLQGVGHELEMADLVAVPAPDVDEGRGGRLAVLLDRAVAQDHHGVAGLEVLVR